MKLPVKITIARSTGGRTADTIVIELTDPKSGIQFMRGEMKMEDFAAALTGHGYCDVDAELRSLANVGKTHVREKRQAIYPHEDGYYSREGREAVREWLDANKQEPGWILDTYLGAQNSIVLHDSKVIVNYHVHKFVEDTK
jgi:hypothetical protein